MVEAIAAVSMEMSAAETANSVEIAMLKKAMNVEQQAAASLLQSLAGTIPAPLPSYGHKLDVLA